MKSWLAERQHVYYFVIALCLGLIIGIVLSPWYSPGFIGNYGMLALGIVFAVMALVKMRRVFILLMLIAGMCLGLFRGTNVQDKLQNYQQFYGSNITVSGVVVDDVNHTSNSKTSIKLGSVKINSVSLDGEVWLSSTTSAPIKRSDTVVARGFLTEGFGSFSASLVRAEIISVEATNVNDIGLQVRDKFAQKTEDQIPEPERSLGLGYLLGIKTELPEDLQKQIQILGLTHVVVASGYNLTILVAFTRRLFASTSKYLSALSGGLMIIGFILITGFSPSMSRAGLVAGLSLLAWYYGRKIHPGTLLVVAMAGTLLVRPSYIWGDIGWYLSFLAFFGILVLAPLLHHYFWGTNKQPSMIRELFVATLSAQIMTLPIILYSFGQYSLYALLANMLILPIVPLCMLATFISGIAGFMGGLLGYIVSLPAVILLKYCTFTIDKISGFANVISELELDLSSVLIVYFLLGLLTLYLILKTKHNFLKDKIIID